MSSWGPFIGGGGAYGTYSNLGYYGALDSYGSLNLTVQSPAQTFFEPLTAQEVFAYLRVNMPASTDDEYQFILALISAAREQAEIMQNKDLVIKQWDLNYDYWMSYRVPMRAPLVSVDLVQYMDSNGDITVLTEGPDEDYIVDTSKMPGSISPPYNGTWPTFTPWPTSSLLFRFTSGYSYTDPFWKDAGARVKIGMKLLISAWFNNRIPYEIGSAAAAEYPFAVTSCLSYGAIVRAR
jgi:uncharacterized phiE125 gp8 family phage protein